MQKRIIKTLLLVSVALFWVGQSLWAVGGQEEGPDTAMPEEAETPSASERYQESPMLAELVRAGELPPVEERLPEEPLVLPVRDSIGTFGGVIRSQGTRDRPLNGFNIGFLSSNTLLTYAGGIRAPVADIVSNIAKDFRNNDEMTEFTIYLREGTKWSDGHPFTTEDLEFYWEHVLPISVLNHRGTPAIFLNSDGTPMEMRIIDEYTIQFSSDIPKPYFWHEVAAGNFAGANLTLHPKHYMSQFHADFVPSDELDAMVEEAGFEDWTQLYTAMRESPMPHSNLEKPVLGAWVPKRMAPELPPWVWERNPYFWAVDAEGNQLPYIDRLEHTKVSFEVMNLNALEGQLNFSWPLDFKLYPDFVDAEDAGRIKLLRWNFATDSSHGLVFNLRVRDEQKRRLFEDVRFRQAVSHCIDREEINDLFFYGTREPQQPMPVAGTELRERTDQFSTLYIEYDPEKANQLLDEIGLDKRSDDGWRLFPNGDELFVNVSTYDTSWADAVELVVDYMNDVGIKTEMKLMDIRLFSERARAHEYDAMMVGGDVIHPAFIGGLRAFVPVLHPFAPYYLEEGEEPPPGPIADNVSRFERMMAEPDPAERLRLQMEIVETARREVWVIGLLDGVPLLGVASPRLGNVPLEFDLLGYHIFSDVARPETYFLRGN